MNDKITISRHQVETIFNYIYKDVYEFVCFFFLPFCDVYVKNNRFFIKGWLQEFIWLVCYFERVFQHFQSYWLCYYIVLMSRVAPQNKIWCSAVILRYLKWTKGLGRGLCSPPCGFLCSHSCSSCWWSSPHTKINKLKINHSKLDSQFRNKNKNSMCLIWKRVQLKMCPLSGCKKKKKKCQTRDETLWLCERTLWPSKHVSYVLIC